MKTNTWEVQTSSKKQDWETPQIIFDKLNKIYHFTWDLAASEKKTKCANYFDIEKNSLAQDWSKLPGNLFCNPPYGRELKLWVKKASETHLRNGQYLVMLIPSRTDTGYWHDYIFDKADIKFLRGRLKFEVDGRAGDPAPFGSSIIIYHSNARKGLPSQNG